MAKRKFKIEEEEVIDQEEVVVPAEAVKSSTAEPTPDEKTLSGREISNGNLHVREKKDPVEKYYMQLDIMGYVDYLNRMSKHATIMERSRISKLNRDISKQIDSENPNLSKEERQKLKQKARLKASVITRTKYILKLIEEDYNKNKNLYEQQLKYNEAYGEIIEDVEGTEVEN